MITIDRNSIPASATIDYPLGFVYPASGRNGIPIIRWTAEIKPWCISLIKDDRQTVNFRVTVQARFRTSVEDRAKTELFNRNMFLKASHQPYSVVAYHIGRGNCP